MQRELLHAAQNPFSINNYANLSEKKPIPFYGFFYHVEPISLVVFASKKKKKKNWTNSANDLIPLMPDAGPKGDRFSECLGERFGDTLALIAAKVCPAAGVVLRMCISQLCWSSGAYGDGDWWIYTIAILDSVKPSRASFAAYQWSYVLACCLDQTAETKSLTFHAADEKIHTPLPLGLTTSPLTWFAAWQISLVKQTSALIRTRTGACHHSHSYVKIGE